MIAKLLINSPHLLNLSPHTRVFLSDGREIRTLNIIYDCNRETLTIQVTLNYPAKRVIETLDALEEEVGLPKTIRSDNGQALISKVFQL